MRAKSPRAERGGPRKTFLSFSAPRIEQDEIAEVVDSLKRGWLTRGPKVLRFEGLFQDYCGAPHAVALNSCTAALQLALHAAGIGKGDEVITTPFTFAATANVILHLGAVPVFADVDPLTMNIDPAQIERRITRRTKAILPVHFAGRPCDMDAILALARRHRLRVIQDAAHALESRYGGRGIAELGDLTCFSFYATKNLTTGEGGMVATARGGWADTVRLMAAHGMTREAWQRYSEKGFKHYRILMPGYVFSMMDLQAAIGLHQIGKVESYLEIRERHWRAYDDAFSDLPLRRPAPPEPGTRHARHLYTVVFEPKALRIGRDEFMEQMRRLKIGTSVHFISLHLQPYYQKRFGFKAGDFPRSRELSESILSLPLTARLSARDIDDAIWAVRKLFKRYRR